MKNYLTSDLLWIALRARQRIVECVADTRDHQMHMNATSELENRYPADTILGGLVRDGNLTGAYIEWSHKV